MVSVSYKLRKFFNTNISNTIKFWECPSRSDWSLHKAVDRETKKFQPTPTFLWKLSWDFSKKRECDDLINRWKMTFQASDDKGCNFLELLNNENNRSTLKMEHGSNTLVTQIHYVLKLQEQSLTMHQSASID